MVILIVDDSKLNLSIAEKILRDNNINCDILLCDSGEAALDILRKEHIDIVLLDIIMGGMTGIETLKIIKGDRSLKNIRVLMLTSLTDKDTLKECFEHGASDFINKPIEQVEFIARVKVVMKDINYESSLKKALALVEMQNKELVETNKKLRETQSYILQKEKISAIGKLAAGIAHELNTPLGYVWSNFEVLEKNIIKFKKILTSYKDLIKLLQQFDISIDVSTMIDKIIEEENSLHLDFIIDDLNDLISESKDGVDKVAKIVQSIRNFASNETEENSKYNDLNQMLEEVLLMSSNEYKNIANINKNFNVLPTINCNRIGIEQVFLNIIVNAVQAIKSQSRLEKGSIQIRTYKEGNYVICAISDDGPGIDEKVISKIFDPFFTTKDVGAGTGLGLSTAYDIIVNKHKGELLVDSVIGKGTTFIVKLPS